MPRTKTENGAGLNASDSGPMIAVRGGQGQYWLTYQDPYPDHPAFEPLQHVDWLKLAGVRPLSEPACALSA